MHYVPVKGPNYGTDLSNSFAIATVSSARRGDLMISTKAAFVCPVLIIRRAWLIRVMQPDSLYRSFVCKSSIKSSDDRLTLANSLKYLTKQALPID